MPRRRPSLLPEAVDRKIDATRRALAPAEKALFAAAMATLKRGRPVDAKLNPSRDGFTIFTTEQAAVVEVA